jgi:hypothetical protein
MAPLTEDHKRRFEADGFDPRQIHRRRTVERRARGSTLVQGRVRDRLYPDEWNWQGPDSPDRTRQICNGWKSDRTVASVVLSERVGALRVIRAQRLGRRAHLPGQRDLEAGGPGAWLSPDDSFRRSAVAHGDLLDRARRHQAAGGTIEYARGSQMGHLAADREVPHRRITRRSSAPRQSAPG